MKSVRLIVAGAGGRGSTYAKYALDYPQQAVVVGVAEPRDFFRQDMAAKHGIPAENVFTDWKQMAQRDRFADAVIIATQDAMHADPAVAFAQKGYDILLEKPMAPSEADCRRIVRAATRHGVLLAVCHVLRYTPLASILKPILDSGQIGQVVSIQHLEPVGYWHQAHSFVRGNWRNESESTFMLMSKSCHDLDWIRFLMARRCVSVSSFGNLTHFRKEAKPPQAGKATRCLQCDYEPQCPYSARRIYLEAAQKGDFDWPVAVFTPDLTVEGVHKHLQDGPYGRCVYECDNDVVDHQVVNLLFEGGMTASFTMTAFTKGIDRTTTVFGTRGMVQTDGRLVKVYDFIGQPTQTIDSEVVDQSILGGHGGGDFGLMSRFVAAVAKRDPSLILSGPAETLESHLMVFAAERARRENRVVSVDQ